MKVIDYKEVMKCLDEVEDSDDKTYAKSLLEWAINKRTFEAIPLSIIENIKNSIIELCPEYNKDKDCTLVMIDVDSVIDIFKEKIEEFETEQNE